MQYARALERTKAILEAGFELVECWEHDFHESTIYLKKNTETVPHAKRPQKRCKNDKTNCTGATKRWRGT